MKFRITKGQNTCDGSDMFYVYRQTDDAARWDYCSGYCHEEQARACVERLRHPAPEVVIDEFEVAS